MANLFAFLFAAVAPLAKRILITLGIGWVSYEALTTLLNTVIGHAQSAWGGLTGAVLSIVSLGGMPEALGIITGAMVARVSFLAVKQLGRVTA